MAPTKSCSLRATVLKDTRKPAQRNCSGVTALITGKRHKYYIHYISLTGAMATTVSFSRLVRRCTRYALGGLAALAAPLARCEEERKEEPFSKILDDAAAGKVQAVRVGADRCEVALKSGRS